MSYNGWSNYETWNVKLWIDNDEGSYGYWRERTRDAWAAAEERGALGRANRRDRAACDLADALEREHADNMPEVSGVYADLLQAALGEVDWREIAEAMLEDEDLKEDEDEEAAEVEDALA